MSPMRGKVMLPTDSSCPGLTRASHAEFAPARDPRVEPGDDEALDHCPTASSHSLIHADRCAATSSGGSSKVFCACGALASKPSGIAPSTTGYIQLVVGISFWKSLETRNCRNCFASVGCFEVFN